MSSATGEKFERAVGIMAQLRAPGGCPWDREQTFDSIKTYTLEETYEVLEAIDNRDWDELTGELGDLLLQVLFYSQMAKEDGTFSIDDVLDRERFKPLLLDQRKKRSSKPLARPLHTSIFLSCHLHTPHFRTLDRFLDDTRQTGRSCTDLFRGVHIIPL